MHLGPEPSDGLGVFYTLYGGRAVAEQPRCEVDAAHSDRKVADVSDVHSTLAGEKDGPRVIKQRGALSETR